MGTTPCRKGMPPTEILPLAQQISVVPVLATDFSNTESHQREIWDADADE